MEKLSAIIEEFRLAMNLISVFYVLYQKFLEVKQIPGSRYLVLAWYIFLVCLSVGYIFICFKMTLSDTLYIYIAVYYTSNLQLYVSGYFLIWSK